MPQAKVRISMTLHPQIDQQLSKWAQTVGKSKSSIIESALRMFFLEKLNEDTKALAAMSFDDLPTEEDWLSIQNND